MQLSTLMNKKISVFTLIAIASLFIIAMPTAQANPQDPQVVSGVAQITAPAANTVQINQTSDKAIINWQSFNINPNEITRFVQPSSNSITLNRINPDHGPSQINGHVTANGQIILVNGAGIIFGPNAYVNVSGLMASTIGITDANFNSGKYIFDQSSYYFGAIDNQGTLIAEKHGLIALMANGVSNEGLIQANMGAVVLASGNKFTVGLNGPNSLINFIIDEQTPTAANDANGNKLRDAITNSGSLIADGGQVIIAAKTAAGIVDHAINMQGVVQANTVDQVNGEIILSGGDHGVVQVTGQLNATGYSENQQGGKIIVLGEYIQAEGHAALDVSGEAGGGEIRLGGNQESGSEKSARESSVYIGSQVSIKADALKKGQKGKIIITSSNKNLGSISFDEKASVEDIIAAYVANDPYAASLPMIMSAELGDMSAYQTTSAQMITMLEMLDKNPSAFPQWMQSNSFKAWMWGRILLAADSISDVKGVSLAKNKLSTLLDGKISPQDNSAFSTWAWGYRAALNKDEYLAASKEMMDGARRLTDEYKASGGHDQLSNALWAWVMNIQAAARAGDKNTYEMIKNEIKTTVGTDSVAVALEKGLLRTAESNDYPAWALAIVRRAAATIGDAELSQEIGVSLSSSINEASKAGAYAEYGFAVLDNQLALLAQMKLKALAAATTTAPKTSGDNNQLDF